MNLPKRITSDNIEAIMALYDKLDAKLAQAQEGRDVDAIDYYSQALMALDAKLDRYEGPLPEYQY